MCSLSSCLEWPWSSTSLAQFCSSKLKICQNTAITQLFFMKYGPVAWPKVWGQSSSSSTTSEYVSSSLSLGIAELIIFKSTIRNILTDVISDTEVLDSFYTQPWFMVLLVSFVEIPFVLVSKIEKLKFLALGGVVGIIIFMVVFVIFFMVAVAD